MKQKSILSILSLLVCLSFLYSYGSDLKPKTQETSIHSSIVTNTNYSLDSLVYKFDADYGNLKIAFILFNKYLNMPDIVSAVDVLYKYSFAENFQEMSDIQKASVERKIQFYLTRYNRQVNTSGAAAILSGLYATIHDTDNALKFITKAVELKPAEYTRLLADYYKIQQNYDLAKEYYLEALKYNVDDTSSMLNLSEILLIYEDNPSESLVYSKKILQLKDKNYYQAGGLAYNSMVKLDYSDKDIIATFSQNLLKLPIEYAYTELGADFVFHFKYMLARKVFNRALTINSQNNNFICLTAAEAFLENNKLDLAKEFFDKIDNTTLSVDNYSKYIELSSSLNSIKN